MMKSPSVEELMKLLGEMTGWGDQSLSVEIGYKRRCDRIAQDETQIDDSDWGFTAETTIRGYDGSIGASGKTLEEALMDLTSMVQKTFDDYRSNAGDRATSSYNILSKFTSEHLR